MMQILCREQQEDEVEQEVTQRDQFDTDEVTLTATLVREPHQNSLDAVVPEMSVHTRIRLIEPSVENADYFLRLFSGLRPHLLASGISLDEIDLGMPRILLIEDFGTTGLIGALDDKKEKSPFNNFWRRIGLSSKQGKSGGRWGLGKLVFSSASKLRTFFGLTIRHSDPIKTSYVMGQAVLTTREVDGRQFAPHVFFATPGKNGLQMPVSDSPTVESFKAAFGITREDEPGLSVAIPFALDQLSADGLVSEVLQNYFFPILMGKLTVDVQGEQISKATFDEVAGRHGWAGGNGEHLIEFIREIYNSEKPDVVLDATWPDDMDGAIAESTILELRTALASGSRLVRVRAPMVLRQKSGQSMPTYFDLYLKKTPDGSKGHSLYVRSAITVPDESRYFVPRQTFGALVASDDAITAFLGDAENPAHTRWNGKADKLKNWKSAEVRLREIRSSLTRLQNTLMQAVESVEANALKDMFSISDILESTTRHRTKKPIKPPVPRPIIVESTTPKLYRIDRINGGFGVRPGQGLTQDQVPFELNIQAAYDVQKGDPFRKYSTFDFDFNKKGIGISSTGASVEPAMPNVLHVTVTSLQFKIDLNGFDCKRDIMINVTRA